MLADQFLEAAAAAKNTYAVDQTARLLWRAHAEGQILDADADAVAAALQARRAAFSTGRASFCCPRRRQGPPTASVGPPDAIRARPIAKPRSSVAAAKP